MKEKQFGKDNGLEFSQNCWKILNPEIQKALLEKQYAPCRKYKNVPNLHSSQENQDKKKKSEKQQLEWCRLTA